MNIVFRTDRQFIQGRFRNVRRRLLGHEIQPASPSQTSSTLAEKSPIWKKVVRGMLLFIAGLGMLSLVVMFLPQIYYTIFPVENQILEIDQQSTVQGGDFDQQLVDDSTATVTTPGRAYVPEFDETLPEGNWIVIPSIGVRTELRETEDPQEALELGVWQVPELGDPGDIEMPMVVAAHRYGWQWWWKDDYWKYHSFYLLPDTQPGDRIEVISGQRKWVYEIYAGEEGDEITDYSGDMILYTCKFLNSPVRHFRYAKLIDPTLNSQSNS